MRRSHPPTHLSHTHTHPPLCPMQLCKEAGLVGGGLHPQHLDVIFALAKDRGARRCGGVGLRACMCVCGGGVGCGSWRWAAPQGAVPSRSPPPSSPPPPTHPPPYPPPRLTFPAFASALSMLAARRGQPLEGVVAQLAAAEGPQLHSASPPPEPVRLHDDRSTYTGGWV